MPKLLTSEQRKEKLQARINLLLDQYKTLDVDLARYREELTAEQRAKIKQALQRAQENTFEVISGTKEDIKFEL